MAQAGRRPPEQLGRLVGRMEDHSPSVLRPLQWKVFLRLQRITFQDEVEPALLPHLESFKDLKEVHFYFAYSGPGYGPTREEIANFVAAIERFRESGCFMAQLTSNNDRVAAHRFYERLGWQKSHAGFKLYLEAH